MSVMLFSVMFGFSLFILYPLLCEGRGVLLRWSPYVVVVVVVIGLIDLFIDQYVCHSLVYHRFILCYLTPVSCWRLEYLNCTENVPDILLTDSVLYASMYVCVWLCVFVYIYSCMCVCVCVCVRVYLYIYIYICVCVCVCVCVCIYTHTHTESRFSVFLTVRFM